MERKSVRKNSELVTLISSSVFQAASLLHTVHTQMHINIRTGSRTNANNNESTDRSINLLFDDHQSESLIR